MIILITFISIIFSQESDFPNDPAGDPNHIKTSAMDGNNIYLTFKNSTELSNWNEGSNEKFSLWPQGGDNPQSMLDGIALLIAGKVYITDDDDSNTLDTEVIDNKVQIDNLLSQDNPGLHEVYFLQTSYREEMDQDPDDFTWGFHPVIDYTSLYSDSPAMSDDPDSWPNGWPSTSTTDKWHGEWNGRFGRGIKYANLETFFVVNDAQDFEYIQNKWYCNNSEGIEEYVDLDVCNEICGQEDCLPTKEFEYYPREGIIVEQSSLSKNEGKPWGGLGLRVEARAFQWNNPLVRDALFWEYSVSNISDYDITEMSFGYWVDNAIGGEKDDEVGYFDRIRDLSYSWDEDGSGTGRPVPGIMGFAFLESPGDKDNGIDDDEDGLVDESREYDAGTLICATCGIDDLDLFLERYNLTSDDLVEHWSGDEDQDWVSSDEECEILNDDVGLDGVGPNDLNYTGPDEDGSECNKKPDCTESKGCEPNFGKTDISESDMIGLKSFKLFEVPSHTFSSSLKWFRNDQTMWDSLMVILDPDDRWDTFAETPANLIEVFASGPFALASLRTERISMAEIHSIDDLTGIPDPNNPPNPYILFKLKDSIQLIYEDDYRFAVPPNMPTLKAEAGDGKVILTWNDIAEQSVDRFLPEEYQEDFQGYKLYRSTSKDWSDINNITDGYGAPTYREPIFQCDKIDGIQGFATYAPNDGISYYLGSDTGLKHTFIDSTVDNGRTYYYGLVAYDHGLNIEEDDKYISPSENVLLLDTDSDSDEVINTSINVVAVTPAVPSAGYVEPWIDTNNDSISGTGEINVRIHASEEIVDDGNYVLSFQNSTDNETYFTTSGFNVSKEVDKCEEFECDLISSQSDCNNQYSCIWDTDTCIQYACNDLESLSVCENSSPSCDWNLGIYEGIWETYTSESLCAEIEYDDQCNEEYGCVWDSDRCTQTLNLDINSTSFYSDIYAIINEDEPKLSLFALSYNDCYKIDFEINNQSEIEYILNDVNRYGNTSCAGELIPGYCEGANNYENFTEQSCLDDDGEWKLYLDNFDAEKFYLYDNGICELHLSPNCQPQDFGNNYCNNLDSKSSCNNNDGCVFNKWDEVYNQSGELSEENNYQDYFKSFTDDEGNEYWSLSDDPYNIPETTSIDGLVFSIENILEGKYKNRNWLNTDSYSGAMQPSIHINEDMDNVKPWNCKIIFTENNEVYKSPKIRSNEIFDENGNNVATNAGGDNYKILSTGIPFVGTIARQHSFDFFIYSEALGDTLDMVIVKMSEVADPLDPNVEYNLLEDKILVGYSPEIDGEDLREWQGTNFSLSFNEYPEPGDIYAIQYDAPFFDTDSLFIHTNAPDSISISEHDLELKNIKVVPNPYIVTNSMEQSFSDKASNRNQQRKIMFTHLPSLCTIKIFTVSGVLVDTIEVENDSNDGKAYWDLLNNEGLEVAAGMYIYHVQSKINEKYKLGKFAIIK